MTAARPGQRSALRHLPALIAHLSCALITVLATVSVLTGNASVLVELGLTVANLIALEFLYALAMEVAKTVSCVVATRDGLELIVVLKVARWFLTVLVTVTVSKANVSVKRVGRVTFVILSHLVLEIVTTGDCVFVANAIAEVDMGASLANGKSALPIVLDMVCVCVLRSVHPVLLCSVHAMLAGMDSIVLCLTVPMTALTMEFAITEHATATTNGQAQTVPHIKIPARTTVPATVPVLRS